MTKILMQQVTQAKDLEQLRKITSSIIGETCWRASLSYGDELSLHIGAKISSSRKSMAGKEKGAWIFGTRGTTWRLDSVGKTLATSEDDPKTIRQKIQIIEGTKITALETTYPELTLTVKFDNGCKLMVIPDAEDNRDLPYWELFTAEQMVIKIGPGAKWSYTRSDLPDFQASDSDLV